MFLYFVKEKDNLYDIAKRYEVSMSKIIQENGLESPSDLSVGDALIINKDTFVYVVKEGDTFASIAKKYHVNEKLLKEDNNQIKGDLKVGDKINVLTIEKNKRKIKVNGYSYPSISNELLEKNLTYLTYLSVFAHLVKENGEIDELNDERIINLSRNYDVAPLMVVTNVKEEGGFSPNLASKILNDDAIIDKVFSNILNILEKKKYYGLNIDFEYVKEEDKDKYEDFLKKAYNYFSSRNYLVTTAVAPKISDEQKGLLYTAHDYEEVGESSDLVMIMTYEWGYTYSPSMPVSPLNKVEDVIEYAVENIDKDKILMGVPNYGYDYRLPYEKNKAAKSLSLNEARKLAFNNSAQIKYYKNSETPYFNYKKDNILHEVQFDNAYSFYKKLELVDKYALAGISIWTIKTYNPSYYTLLDHYFEIEKVL